MNYLNILKLKEPFSQMSMVWRLDFSIIRFQGELLFLAQTGFSPSRLDVFVVRTWTISFTYFKFLNTITFRNLRIDVLDVMTSRFWDS